ncbi:MAG: adenylate/guanylate cyclase domain-containing protein [Aeromicrobium sp.]
MTFTVALLSGLLTLSVLGLGLVWLRLARARREVSRLHRILAGRRDPRLLHTAGRAANAVRVVAETAAKVRDRGVSGFLTSSAEDLARWARDDRKGIASVAGPDGAVTIFFSDIEDSTTLNESLGDRAWMSMLAKHDTVVRANVERFRGHVVKSQGDGFMIVFHDPEAAVHAGIAIQTAFIAGRGRRLRRTPLRVRIGVHAGSAIEKGGDYFGRNVAMAARVAAQAEGGEILVSDEVRSSLADDTNIRLVEQMDVELKGFSGVHTLWLVEMPV